MANEQVKKNTKESNVKGTKTAKKADNQPKNTAKKKSTTTNKTTKSGRTATSKAVASTKKIEENVLVEDTTKNEIKANNVVSAKKTNEIVRMIIVIAILVALIVTTFIIGITFNGNKFLYQKHVGIKDVSISEYLDIIDDNDISIIYIARPTCGFCSKFEPVLTSVLEKYKIGVEYINVDNITTEEEFNSFFNSNEYLKAGEWGTPTLIVFKNKEILDINSGYVDEETLVKFLKENELIKGE